MYFELLFDAILTHWKPQNIDMTKIHLDEANKYQAKSEAGFTYFY